MGARVVGRAVAVGLLCALSAAACSPGAPPDVAAPPPVNRGASPPAEPEQPSVVEAELGDDLPSLRPRARAWQVTGADSVARFLQEQVELLSVGRNEVSIVPVAASPTLAGFRMRVSSAGFPRTSRTFWFSLPSGTVLSNADLLTSAEVPARGLSFTPSGDLYWETPHGTGWGSRSAPAAGALTRLGMLARAAALNPLDPGGDPPVDCSAVKCVALTFDDGPGPGTAGLLRTLADNGGRATFFVNGEHVPGHEDLLWAMVAAGDELGNHNQTHVRLSGLPDSQVAAEVARTDALISPMCDGTKVFRPPYGDFDESVRRTVEQQGYSIVLWNLDPLDYRTTDSALIAQRVLAGVRPGSVVLSHDTLPSTEVAYRTIIPELRARGYHLVTVDELLGPGRAGSVRGGY